MGLDLGFALAQAGVYYAIMLGLFWYRRWLGVGTFFCALCALTFAENYLAITVFVAIGPMTYTPGSVVLFTGKLLLLLLAYIREDAQAVRQPIYGLLIGNFVIILVVLLVSHQTRVGTNAAGFAIDMVAGSTWLSVWGTLLLFIDSVAIILLYERLSSIRWLNLFFRMWVCAIVVLAFDQFAFFAALYTFFGVPFSAGAGGLVGKIVASGVYSFVLWAYLRFLEHHRDSAERHQKVSDVFDILTYRQRFEAMRETARIDELTGAKNRRALLDVGPPLVDASLARGEPVSLFMIDLDGFKRVNDLYGHAAGDRLLCEFVDVIRSTSRESDPVFRFGGDEFVIIAAGAGRERAEALAAAIRENAAGLEVAGRTGEISVSVGIATGPADGTSLTELLETADRSMYASRDRRRGAGEG